MKEEKDFQTAHFRDLARIAGKSSVERFTRFIDPSAIEEAVKAARDERVLLSLFGGYPEAERVVAAFYSFEKPVEFPIKAIKIEWNAKFAVVNHRDLLGAVMGLGQDRSLYGDIVMGRDHCAYIFVLKEAAQYLKDNLKEAGRAGLKLSDIAIEDIEIAPPDGKTFSVVVNSARLDAVISKTLGISRESARNLIEAGLVKVNHSIQKKADTAVGNNTLISVRGHGRLKIISDATETAKGRLRITVFAY